MLKTLCALDRLAEGLDALRERLRIAVVHNGDRRAPGAVIRPTHNPRSEKCYRPVAEDIAGALRALGFRHVSLMPDDLRLVERLRRERVDLAWLNTAGVQGYDAAGHAAAVLELAGIPYVGHRPLAALTLDCKHVFKRECQGLGLPTAPFHVWDGAAGPSLADDPGFAAAFGDRRGPFVVKPVSGRASLHVHVVADRAGAAEAAQAVWARTLNPVLVESWLGGPEYCVAVAGPVRARGRRLVREAAPFAFSALERRLDPGEAIFTSMDARPITLDRVRPLDPGAGEGAALAALGRAVWRGLRLGALVRLDVRADDQGRLHLLEANPKPDLKRPAGDRVSLVCAGLAAEGMDYEDLILSQLADRLEHDLRHRPACVRHVAALLD